MAKINPHKGGRTDLFKARCTPADKAALESIAARHNASMSDVLIGLIRALDGFTIVEAHALIHGIKAWAFREGEDDNNGTTIVVFGNGKQIRQDGREYSGDFPALDIEDFFTGFYFDSLFGSLPAQDESLLKA